MSSTSDKNKKIKYDVPTRADGTVGVRATLRNMGISNDRIGYNEQNKTVTLGGRELMKPSYIDEDAGVSYAKPSDIQKSLVSYYSGSTNPIVKVSDAYASYAGRYGISADALGYTNGTVTIGGTPVDVLYIDDEGKSWAFQNDIESSVYNYLNTLGAETAADIANEYDDRYLNRIDRLINSVSNREEFSYDPEQDPVYQAYRESYLREGNRAVEDVLAGYSAQTGGYLNSSAVTAAAQTGQYYRSMLTDKIPELAQQAYERYSDKYNTDIDLLGSILDVYDTAYGNAYGANNKTVSNINSVLSSNADRDSSSIERYWDSLFNEQKYETTERENEWDEIFNGQEYSQNALDIESMRNENAIRQIYLQYYNRLLESQLQSEALDNRLTQEKINQLILQNMLMTW